MLEEDSAEVCALKLSMWWRGSQSVWCSLFRLDSDATHTLLVIAFDAYEAQRLRSDTKRGTFHDVDAS